VDLRSIAARLAARCGRARTAGVAESPRDDPTTGWFAYLPDGSRPEDLSEEDPEIGYVELR